MVYNWIQSIQEQLYPPRCLLCGGRGDRGVDLCGPCRQELPHNRHPCLRCALPLPPTAPVDSLCGRCQQRPPPFEHCTTPLIYLQPIDRLITGLKFHAKLQYGRMLATLLLQHIQRVYPTALPQLLIPVPLHPERLQERGYNQALELARPLSKRLNIPLDYSSCRRTIATRSQSELHERERHRNIRGAFELSGEITAKYVVIVDDVVTTGSTVIELTNVLHRAGVPQVDVWAVARTP